LPRWRGSSTSGEPRRVELERGTFNRAIKNFVFTGVQPVDLAALKAAFRAALAEGDVHGAGAGLLPAALHAAPPRAWGGSSRRRKRPDKTPVLDRLNHAAINLQRQARSSSPIYGQRGLLSRGRQRTGNLLHRHPDAFGHPCLYIP
jgi:hypothetical protein